MDEKQPNVDEKMREYILTDREREATEDFLTDKKRSMNVRVIRHRARKVLSRLKDDIALLEQLIK